MQPEYRAAGAVRAAVREAPCRISVENDAERHVREVVALRNHLRPDEHAGVGLLEAGEDSRDRRTLGGRVGIEAEHRQWGSEIKDLVLELLRAGAMARQRHRPALLAYGGHRL